MSKEIHLNIDDLLYNKLEKQFNEFGVSIENGINILISDFVDDTSTFSIDKPTRRPNNSKPNDEIMNKSFAKQLFLQNGFKMFSTYTYASRGREGSSSSEIYWANPSFDFLREDWSIVFNDKPNRIIYLINIPRNTFTTKDFVSRSDKHLIDMRVPYNDRYFTDMASGTSLYKHAVASIDYNQIDNPIIRKF